MQQHPSVVHVFLILLVCLPFETCIQVNSYIHTTIYLHEIEKYMIYIVQIFGMINHLLPLLYIDIAIIRLKYWWWRRYLWVLSRDPSTK